MFDGKKEWNQASYDYNRQSEKNQDELPGVIDIKARLPE